MITHNSTVELRHLATQKLVRKYMSENMDENAATHIAEQTISTVSGLCLKFFVEDSLTIIEAEQKAKKILDDTKLTGLARRLFADCLLSEKEADDAFKKALKIQGTTFVDYLVGHKILNAKEIAHSAAREFGVPLINIDELSLNVELVKKIDENILKKHKVIPIFERNKRLFIAISDPTNLPALDAVKFHTGMSIEPILVEEDKLLQWVEKTVEIFDVSVSDLNAEVNNNLFSTEVEGSEVHEDDSPLVKFVNKMLIDAVKMGASDVHFEPYEKFYRVRFRIDGSFKIIAQPPLALSQKVAQRIKLMAHLNVSEKHAPQAGRIKMNMAKNGATDFRVTTCPTLFGEKIAIRLLDSSLSKLNIDLLGYEEEMGKFKLGNQKDLYLNALAQSHGMIVITGPMDSGKTNSLYTGINILNKEGKNVSTVEEFVEFYLPGANQVQVNEKTGMSFDKAINTFLQQNSDVILVSEINNLDTCNAAIRAAMRCVVLSALYAEDAPMAVFHIISMGISPFFITTAVKLVVAQRLCRRLCSCKIKQDLPRKTLFHEGFKKEDIDGNANKDISPLILYAPKGCEKCDNTGYRGRIGVYQVMPITEAMKEMIRENCDAQELAGRAEREGIPNLRQAGLKKVKDGLTSLEEINRVIPKQLN